MEIWTRSQHIKFFLEKMIEDLATQLGVKVCSFLEVTPHEPIEFPMIEPYLKDIEKYDEQTKELKMLRFFDMTTDKGDPTQKKTEELQFMEMSTIFQSLAEKSATVGILEVVEDENKSNAMKMAILYQH